MILCVWIKFRLEEGDLLANARVDGHRRKLQLCDIMGVQQEGKLLGTIMTINVPGVKTLILAVRVASLRWLVVLC